MTLINRYILRIYARLFGLSLAAFVGIYLLIDFFERVDDFIEAGAPVSLYLIYFFNKIPIIVVQILPLGVLMATFLTLGGLARTQELTALRAGGLSLARIASPLLWSALALSLATLLAQEYLVPLHAQKVNSLWSTQIKGRSDMTYSVEQIWFREGQDIYSIRQVLPSEGTMQGISVYEVDKDMQILRSIDAPTAVFGSQGWVFQNPIIRTFSPGGQLLSQKKLEHIRFPLDKTPQDFQTATPKEDELGFFKLYDLIKQQEAEGSDVTRLRVNMQSRLATPFASLVMAFLGIPFALQKGRASGPALGLALSIAIGISYHLLQAMLAALGFSGVLPPLLAAWAPNMLFAMLGLYLLLSVRE